jgi:hypothetical protein
MKPESESRPQLPEHEPPQPLQPRPTILWEQLPTRSGVIAFCDAEGGLIDATDGQYVFYLRDITSGFAERGCSVQFKPLSENPPRAVSIEIA